MAGQKLSKLFKKTLIVTSLVFLVLIIAISDFISYQIYKNLISESESKGIAIAKSVADAGVDLILNSDAATLQSKVNQYLNIDGVAYLIVRNANYEVISHTFVPVIPDILKKYHKNVINTETRFFEEDVMVKRLKDDNGFKVIDITVPILSGEIGIVHVGMDLNPIWAKIIEMISKLVAILVLIYLLGLILLFILMSRISKPLQDLMHYAKELGQHHFKSIHPLHAEITEIGQKTKNEIGELSTAFVDMEDQLIENIKTLEKTIMAKQTIETELKVAKSIQMSMLPKDTDLSKQESLSIKGYIEPAREVGGDFYDYFMRRSQSCYFLVGDVSGKGASAALFMTMALTILRSVSHQLSDLSDILKHVNTYLCDHNDKGLFVTVWIGALDLNTGELTYINAGHPQPILKNKSGEISLLPFTDGVALGVDEDFYYQQERITLSEGDSLCLFTDGVTEAMNKDDQLFGEDTLATHVQTCSETEPEKVEAYLLSRLEDFVGEADQHDDITLLNLSWHPQPIIVTNPLKVHFKNEISEIAKLHAVIEQFSTTFKLPGTMAMNANLVLEELLSNIIFYGYDDHDEHMIYVSLQHKETKLDITIEDDGSPFNPLEQEEIDLTTSLEDTEVGGLGIHFVKTLTTDITYKREGNKNVLVMSLTEAT